MYIDIGESTVMEQHAQYDYRRATQGPPNRPNMIIEEPPRVPQIGPI